MYFKLLKAAEVDASQIPGGNWGFHFALAHSSYNNKPQPPLLTDSNNACNVPRQMFNLHMWLYPVLPGVHFCTSGCTKE